MSNTSGRFYGRIGYIRTETDDYGVSIPISTTREYYGNILSLSSRWQQTENLNDDVTIGHRISVIADPYALQNFPYIRYVEWMGTLWEVKSVRVEYPRLVLTLGGVYNGEQT